MENLYKTLESKKTQINRFSTKVEGDYFIYFVEGFLPEMIETIINNLREKDAIKIDGLNDILIKYKLFFMKRFTEITPEYIINSHEEDAFINLPKSDGEELMKKIITFFRENGMITDIHAKYDSTVAPNIYEIETSLNKLISAYGIELSKEGKVRECFEETERLLTRANHKMLYLDSVLVDDVHSKVFEDEFLDKCLVTIIKDKINNLTKRNFSTEVAKDALIQGKLIIKEEGKDGGYITVKPNEVDNTLLLIRNFMASYGLGTVDYNHNIGITVNFKTNLADLMDAYYMEKQRIEYYTSGDYLVEEAEPTAKRMQTV